MISFLRDHSLLNNDLLVLDGVAGIHVESVDKWFEDKTRV